MVSACTKYATIWSCSWYGVSTKLDKAFAFEFIGFAGDTWKLTILLQFFQKRFIHIVIWHPLVFIKDFSPFCLLFRSVFTWRTGITCIKISPPVVAPHFQEGIPFEGYPQKLMTSFKIVSNSCKVTIMTILLIIHTKYINFWLFGYFFCIVFGVCD